MNALLFWLSSSSFAFRSASRFALNRRTSSSRTRRRAPVFVNGMLPSSRSPTKYCRETFSRFAACCVVSSVRHEHDGIAASEDFGGFFQDMEDYFGDGSPVAVWGDERATRLLSCLRELTERTRQSSDRGLLRLQCRDGLHAARRSLG